MTRVVIAIDRLAAFVFGVVFLAIGVGALLWNTHWIPRTPELVTAPGLVTASGTHWWPWAEAGVGLVLVLLAVRWLVAHLPMTRVSQRTLSVGDGGVVSADLGEVAAAAARALQACPDVHSAKGRAVLDRGVATIDLTVTPHSPTTLGAVVEAVDEVSAQIAVVLGADAVATRTSVHVDARKRRDRVG
jgi:hypothetical protein